MRVRNLFYNQIQKIAPGLYQLAGHPEVTIVRYESPGFKGWEIRLNGASTFSGPCGGLDDVDRSLNRFGDCEDCGKFCKRIDHPAVRCHGCAARHAELEAGYRRGACAAALTLRAFALAQELRSAPALRAAAELLAKPGTGNAIIL